MPPDWGRFGRTLKGPSVVGRPTWVGSDQVDPYMDNGIGSIATNPIFEPSTTALNAIRFGATAGNDWLQATQVPTFDLHTICGWFRWRQDQVPLSVQMSGMSLESVAPDASGPYQLLCETTFQLNRIELHDSAQGGFLFTSPDPPQAASSPAFDWVFICSTNNAPGDTVFYWRWAWNSVLQVSTGNTHPSMSGATRFLIGSDDAGSQNEFWDGDIAGVKWWSAKLSQAEVDAESRQLYPVRSANLGAYYPFQDIASMLTDASGNGATLTNPSGTGSWTLRNDGPRIPLGTPTSIIYTASLSENVGAIGESLSVQAIDTVGLSESVGAVGESVAVQAIDTIGLSENVGAIGESLQAGLLFTASLSENVGAVGESVAVQAIDTVGLSESVGAVGESVAVQAIDTIALSENVGAIGESVTQFVALPVNLSENVGAVGESLATQMSAVVALAENPALTESLATQATYNVGLSENVPLSEALVAGLLFQLSLSENVGAVGEALSVVYAAIVNPSETVGLSESLATQATFNVGLSENVPLAEALSAGIVYQLALSENVGAIGEALAIVLKAIVNPSETVGLSEAFVTQAIYQVAPSETVPLSESVSAGQVFQLALSETVTLSEAISVAKQFVVTLNETVAITEAVAAAATYAANLSENVAIADQLTVQARSIVQLAESAIAIGESLDAHQGAIIPVDLAETVPLLEQVVLTIFRRTWQLVSMVSPGEFNAAFVLVPGLTGATPTSNGITSAATTTDGINTLKVIG